MTFSCFVQFYGGFRCTKNLLDGVQLHEGSATLDFCFVGGSDTEGFS